MRILQVINNLNTGGAEKLLIDSIPRYLEKNIDMELLILNGTDFPFLRILKEQTTCTIHELGKGSIYNPFLIFRIIPFLKKYDIIHVHLFPSQYWTVIAKMISFSKVKIIMTEHSVMNRRLKKRLLRWLNRMIYKLYDRIICITDEIKITYLNDIVPSEDKLIVIENGVNLSEIKNAKPLDLSQVEQTISKEDRIIIQVAAFRYEKDQQTLIKALHLLPQKIKLLLIGEGKYREQCEDLVNELNLCNRVFFIGIRMDVPRLLKSSDIVVLSTKYEGLSLSCIEGMASGKPFVASKVPGVKKIVEGAGLLFDQGDEKQLANLITMLMEDEDFRERTVVNCLNRSMRYDINNMVDQYIKLYNTIYKQ